MAAGGRKNDEALAAALAAGKTVADAAAPRMMSMATHRHPVAVDDASKPLYRL
jgi:hypothetical protein